MGIKYDFTNPEELAEFIVGKSILKSMAKGKRKNIIKRAVYVICKYKKSELLVCDILSSSAEKGRLEECLGELEVHCYQGNIQYLSPLRRLIVHGM